MSIYANLFGYRPRPQRLPMEDFLSAALVDLLNRLPDVEGAAFVGDVLLTGEARSNWRKYAAVQPAPRLRWRTQFHVVNGVERGRADIVLLVDGRPAIIVENKITAAVGMREPDKSGLPIPPAPEVERPSTIREKPTQLHVYGRWLSDVCDKRAWPGALVLLTHLTPPPHGFDQGSEGGIYGSAHRTVCRWRQVWQWAQKNGGRAATLGAGSPQVASLTGELAHFLERHSMGGEGINNTDIAAMEGYFGALGRVEHSMTDITSRLTRSRAELNMGSPSRVYYTPLMAAVWCWSYLTRPPGNKWYIGWGIRFPEYSRRHWTEFQPPLPDVPHLFVTLGTEGKIIPWDKLTGELPDGWVRTATSEIVVGRRLDGFPPAGDEFAAAAARWIEDELLGLRQRLDEMVRIAMPDATPSSANL